MSCQRITPQEYERQSEQFSRASVSHLVRTKEFRQFQSVRNQENTLQEAWVWGPILLLFLMYFDVVFSFVSNTKPIGSTLRLFPVIAVPLGLFVILFPCGMALMAPWCDSSKKLRYLIQVHCIAALGLAALPYSFDAAPFLPDTPMSYNIISFKRADLSDRKKIAEIGWKFLLAQRYEELFWRAAALLPPMIVGFFFYRGLAGRFWKQRWIVRWPLLTLSPVFALATLLMWKYTAEWVSIHSDNSSNARIANTLQELFGMVHRDIHAVIVSPSVLIDPDQARRTMTALTAYSWAILLSHLFVPLAALIGRVFLSLLPTNPIIWFLTLVSSLGAGVYTFLNGTLTFPIGMTVGGIVLILLLRGFES